MDEPSRTVESRVKDRTMDVAPVGIVLSDPRVEDNPLIYANETFVELTAYPREEILGRNCRFLQGSETDPAAVAEMREAIDEEEPVTVEILNYRSDGERFWNEVTIAPVYDGSDSLLHFVGFQSDVTERKEAERALRGRTRELEHLLARLDGLLQDITEELMHAESREETEQTICERFVESEPYQFAWVGEFEPVTETIEPTNWAGDVDEFGGGPIEEPAAAVLSRALEETHVVTVTERRELEELGSKDGVGAVAVVPLRYQRQRYGVLVVGAEKAERLSEPETTILGSLGQTIATAINAAQTRRSLADDTRVIAEFAITDPLFPPVLLSERSGATLTFEGAVERRDGTTVMFFTTTEAVASLRSALDTSDTIDSLVEISRFGDERLVELRERAPSTVGWFAQLGATIGELTVVDGRAQLKLILMSTVDGRSVVQQVRDRYKNTELTEYRSEERPPETRVDFRDRLTDRLTDRQHLVLKRAFLSGFYERRRRTTGQELAESLDISRSTFHQHLRAAERKLIEETFSN